MLNMLFLNLLITQKHTKEKSQNHGFGVLVYVFRLLLQENIY